MITLQYFSWFELVYILLAVLGGTQFGWWINTRNKPKPVMIVEGYAHSSFFKEFNRWIPIDHFNEEYLAIVKDRKEGGDIQVTAVLYATLEEK